MNEFDEDTFKSVTSGTLLLYVCDPVSYKNVITSLIRYQIETMELIDSGIAADGSSEIFVSERQDSTNKNEPSIWLLKDIHDCLVLLII